MVDQTDEPPPSGDEGGRKTSTGQGGTRREDTTSRGSDQPPPFRYSLVEHRTDNRPTEHEDTLSGLAELLRDHGDRIDKKNGPGFLPATFEEGVRRANENVEAVHWLALDVEETRGDVDELQGPLTNYRRIVYSTRSHGLRKTEDGDEKWTPGEPRFRVLIPLADPLDREAYRALWRHVYGLLEGAPDEACSDPARLMYTPRTRHPRAERATFLELHEDGPTLDPTALPDGSGGTVSVDDLVAERRAEREAADKFDPPKSLEDAGWVKDALEHIDPDVEYPTWMPIGTALKATFGDEAFGLFDDWSSGGDKYDGPAICREKWNSFPDDPPGAVAGGGVTLATIWHLAAESGWTPPEGAYSRDPRPNPLDPYEGTERLTLEEGRSKADDTIGSFLRENDEGKLYVDADPGTGKTRAALDGILDRWKAGGRILYQTGTNDVLEEQKDRLLDWGEEREDVEINALLDAVGVEPKRTRDNCARFKEYLAFQQTIEGGGHAFCQSCELHPENQSDPSNYCPFILEKWDYEEDPPDIMFTTHTMEARRRGLPEHEDTDRDQQIRWTQIIEAVRGTQTDLEGGGFEGVLDVTPNTEMLKIRRTENGRCPPELEEGGEYTLEDGSPSVTADGRDRIRQWLADDTPIPGDDRDALFGYYRSRARDSEFDVAVADESVLDALLETTKVTLEDLRRWKENGDLKGSDGWFERVQEAIAQTAREGKDCVEGVADRLPANLTAVEDNEGDPRNATGRDYFEDADDAIGTEGAQKAVEDAPDWRALEVLEHLSRIGWTGARIVDPAESEEDEPFLLIPRAARLDLQRADQWLALDGTGEWVAADAILGADCEYESIKVEPPESTTIQQVDYNLDKWKLSELDAKRQRTLAESQRFRNEGGEHVHVTRKDHNPNVDEEERSPHAEGDVRAGRERHVDELESSTLDTDQILHVGGTRTRGSNEFEDCSSVTLPSYYVPRSAIDQRAALLDQLTDGRHTEVVHAAASWQLEASEIVQAAHRIRFLEGEATVTYCDTRTIPGLDPDRVIDRTELDTETARTTGHLENYNGGHVAEWLLRRLVEANGGAMIGPIPGEDGLFARCTRRPHKDPLSDVRVQCANGKIREALNTAWKDRWDGSWSTAAEAAGLEFTRLETSNGGAGTPILSVDPVDRTTVADLVARLGPGWSWYEFEGERYELGESPADELRRGIRMLGSTDGFLEAGVCRKREMLGGVLGVSSSTVRRRMKAAEWSEEDLERVYREEHSEPLEPAPPDTPTIRGADGSPEPAGTDTAGVDPRSPPEPETNTDTSAGSRDPPRAEYVGIDTKQAARGRRIRAPD